MRHPHGIECVGEGRTGIQPRQEPPVTRSPCLPRRTRDITHGTKQQIVKLPAPNPGQAGLYIPSGFLG